MKTFNAALDNFKNIVKKNMGISTFERISNDFEFKYSEFAKVEIELKTKGKDIKLKDIQISKDKTLEYLGKKVVLYIRDQFTPTKSKYKFHIAWCDHLKEMDKSGRSKRYVVNNRKDGKFIVNLFDANAKNKLLHEGQEVEMEVCVKCLDELSYKGFVFSHKTFEKHVKKFKLSEFFKEYDTNFNVSDFSSASIQPLNHYSHNWDKISKAYREKVKWACEKCGKNCSSNKGFLEVHHIDRNKFNSIEKNLKALCHDCHLKEHENDY